MNIKFCFFGKNILFFRVGFWERKIGEKSVFGICSHVIIKISFHHARMADTEKFDAIMPKILYNEKLSGGSHLHGT